MRTLAEIEYLDPCVAPTFQEWAVAYDARHPDDTGPLCILAIGSDIRSSNFRNVSFPNFESAARACAGLIPTSAKEMSFIHCNGALSANGVRQQNNIAAFDVLMLDYDKGFACVEKVHERLRNLGLLSAVWPSFNDGRTTHSVAHSGTKHILKTGETVSVAYPFGRFCAGREPTDELARQFCIEIEGYAPSAVGDVRIVGKRIEKRGSPVKIETIYYDLAHGPIPKCRAMIAIDHFARQPDESNASFQRRWSRFYHAGGNWIGIPYDQSCDTIERAYFGLTYNAAWPAPPVPLIHRGQVLSHDDDRLVFAEPSARLPANGRKPTRPAPHAASRPLTRDERSAERKWRGFRAADAAAHLYPEHVTDKREDKNLVAIDCPFIEEHATSYKPGTRQLSLYNARDKHSSPHAKCFSETCRRREPCDFLDALFDAKQRGAFKK
jgi:hypothetical protein